MKAMSLFTSGKIEDNPLKLVEIEPPNAGKDEIRIKVEVCGVCHTDLHICEGDIIPPKYPIIPGHQAVGIVDQVGEGVDGIRVGERLGAAWLGWADGKCEFCLRGEENLCPDIRFHGFNFNGGFAEWMVIRAAFAVHLPAKLSAPDAAPWLCAGTIGYRALKLAEVRKGDWIGLVGFGASAHLALQLAKHWGCHIMVFTRSKAHQEHALSLGAEWAGGLEEDAPRLCDRAILFAPSGNTVPLTLNKIRRGGNLAINAVTMTDIPGFPFTNLYGEKTVRAVTNATRKDAIETMEWVEKTGIRAMTTIYALEEANQALKDIKMSSINGEAVLKL